MPYSTECKKEKFEWVETQLEELNSLPSGRSLLIHLDSERLARQAAWTFRDFLHLTGTKDKYKVKELSGDLVISRESPTLSSITTLSSKGLQRDYDEVMESLLVSEDLEGDLVKLIKSKSVSLTVLGKIISEYARVMGD